MFKLKDNIAVSYGINAGLIAQFLWENIELEHQSEFNIFRKEKNWFRCSVKTMTGIMPFLTRSQIKDSIKILIENGVIKKECFNMNKFDKTSWYTFTAFGQLLMETPDHDKERLYEILRKGGEHGYRKDETQSNE